MMIYMYVPDKNDILNVDICIDWCKYIDFECFKSL